MIHGIPLEGRDVSGASPPARTIAVLTLDGFNEVDSFVITNLLGRVGDPAWRVHIASPAPVVTSMNGITVHAQMSLDDLSSADAVIIGSGIRSHEHAADRTFLAAIQLDPTRQLIGSRCSGALLLERLGLLGGVPASTDTTSRPRLIEAGIDVIDGPFHAAGNLATAGGCLSGQYLGAWLITRLAGADAARHALHAIAPVGEQDEYVQRALGHVCGGGE